MTTTARRLRASVASAMNAGKTTTAKRCIDQSGTLSETNVSGIATLVRV